MNSKFKNQLSGKLNIYILVSVTIIFFGVLSVLLQKVSFDNARWLEDDHPVEVNKDFVKENFLPYEELIIIFSLKESVFAESTLQSLQKLSAELERHDRIDNVKTPVTAQLIVGSKNTITLTSLASAYEKDMIETKTALEEVFTDSIYNKILASAELDQALIVINHQLPKVLSEYKERDRIIADVINIVKEYTFFTDYKLAGGTFLSHQIDHLNISNLKTLVTSVFALVIVLLTMVYRHHLRVIMVLFSSIICLIYTLTIFKLFNQEITIISMVLPILVIVISLSDSIFINARAELLFEKYNNQKRLFIRHLIKQTWMPCFLTSLTTSIGFGSFYFSEILPLNVLSYLSVISILGSYVIIVCLNWLLIYWLFDELKEIAAIDKNQKYFDFILAISNKLVTKYPKQIISVTIVIVLLFSLGLSKIYTETNFIRIFFKDSHAVTKNHQIIDDLYHGSSNIDFIISDQNFTFQDIESFNKLKKMKNDLAKISLTNNLLSYHDIISMVHTGFLPNETYPADSFQLEQEVLFLEFSKNDSSSDVLEPYLNFPKTASRIEIKTDNLTSLEIDGLISEVKEVIKQNNISEDDYFLSGHNIYFHSLSKYIISTQLISVLIAFIFITLLIFIIFNIKIALLSIIPNFFPPLITLGAVSWLNIPFDFSTILIASISFGITIDSSIHLIHVYQSLEKSNTDHTKIRTELLNIVGKPIIISCTIFSLIFSLFIFSDIVMLIKFGVFSFIAIFSSLLINLLVIPATREALDQGSPGAVKGLASMRSRS